MPDEPNMGQPETAGGRAWVCSCGWQAETPEALPGHRSRENAVDRKAGRPPGHRAIGYVDLETGEVIVKHSPTAYRGRWVKKVAEHDARREPPPVTPAHDPSRDGAGVVDEAPTPSDSGLSVPRSWWRPPDEDGGDGEDGEAEEEEEENQLLQPLGRVRLQVRPVVYEVGEELVHLYHLVVASIQAMGVSDYSPEMGEWLRDTVFEFYREHPEIVDLRRLFTAEESAELRVRALTEVGA